ncbi:MAG: tetratricopeptide repeat protein [Verrucomicrobia bacterium]|nr:tetratricopeptide repeat protein [Verrucomicrobiota bacterium]
MATPREWFLVSLMLVVSASGLVAASAEEQRDYRAATNALAVSSWERAERELAEFIAKYPESTLLPEAVLRQAQAQFKQRKFAEAITALTAGESKAGSLADQYLHWLAEAQFQTADYAAAAANFGKLAREFGTSPIRLEASVREAESQGKLGQWEAVADLLGKPDGAFRQAMPAAPESEAATRGLLLLAEAALNLKRFAESEVALATPAPNSLKPEFGWRRQYLLCQVQFALGRTNEALAGTTNLLALAETTPRRELLPESVAFRAGLLEQLGQWEGAKAAYALNLSTNAPPGRQRQALTKIAQIALAQNRLEEAIQRVEQFLLQFTNSPATDVALLTHGELLLRHSAASVPRALASFDQLINTWSNSNLIGKAQLGRGWCHWISNNLPASAEAFKLAAEQLALSEDLAVARFKLADALFAQRDFAGALQNYRAAYEIATNWPRVKDTLTTQSLYQVLRSSLELKDLTGASDAMKQLLQSYPNSPVADRSVLLVAQGFSELDEPERARALFGEFIEKFPESALRPEVELALAHTYEQKADWSGAIGAYEQWLNRFATNALRPQAEFYRALANFRAGNETNAFALFTNFVAQFRSHELAPKAQWWVADYYDRQGAEFNLFAEASYKLLFQTWPASPQALEARMMAGRVALARPDYPAAIEHFTNLTLNPACPPALKLRAKFGYGAALMSLNPGETNKTANLELAIQVFSTIPQEQPGTESAAHAWFEIARCYFQLAALDARHYESASNAWQQVFNSPAAGFAVRAQARIGLGKVAEAQAAAKAGDERTVLLKQALNHYLDVFLYDKILREGEQPDWFWVRYAGQEAARVAESLEDWAQALSLYRGLQKLLPPLQASLEKRIARAQERLGVGKN